MLYGVANSAPAKQTANPHALNEFRAAFEGRILPIADCFEHYAAEKTCLRRAGRPVDDFDLMIGCTALRHGLTLITRNTRHFSGIANLALENWIDTAPPVEGNDAR